MRNQVSQARVGGLFFASLVLKFFFAFFLQVSPVSRGMQSVTASQLLP
jgi:hypothetical protein